MSRRQLLDRLRDEARRAFPLLLAGCASAPPPPPPSAPVEVAEAPQPPAPARREPLPPGTTQTVLDDDGPPWPATGSAQVVKFGAGAAAVFTFNGGNPNGWLVRCPLLTERGCSLMAVSAGEGGPPSGWFGPVSGWASPWSKPKGAPNYQGVFPGRRHVYLTHEEGIDRVGPDGEPTLWLKNRPSGDPTLVVETKSRVISATLGSPYFYANALIEKDGHGWPASELIIRNYVVLPQGITTNQTRGFIREHKHPALYPQASAVPLLDARGELTDRWAMAVYEIVPPPYSVKPGTLYRKGKLGRVRARHECGSSSRPLGDRSVEKRLHLFRMGADSLESDDVVALSEDFAPLQAQPLPGGKVAINGVVYDEQGKKAGELPQDKAEPPSPFAGLTMPAAEEIAALAYDEKAGEGMVVVRQGFDRAMARKLDASGALSGPAFEVPLPVTAPVKALVRFRGGYLAWAGDKRLCRIDGPDAGRCLDLPERPLAAPRLDPDDDGLVQLLIARGEKRAWLTVKLDDGSVVREKETNEQPRDEAPDPNRVELPDPQGAPALLGACPRWAELPQARALLACTEATDHDTPRWKAVLRVVSVKQQANKKGE